MSDESQQSVPNEILKTVSTLTEKVGAIGEKLVQIEAQSTARSDVINVKIDSQAAQTRDLQTNVKQLPDGNAVQVKVDETHTKKFRQYWVVNAAIGSIVLWFIYDFKRDFKAGESDRIQHERISDGKVEQLIPVIKSLEKSIDDVKQDLMDSSNKRGIFEREIGLKLESNLKHVEDIVRPIGAQIELFKIIQADRQQTPANPNAVKSP